jgi:hypothetical protein
MRRSNPSDCDFLRELDAEAAGRATFEKSLEKRVCMQALQRATIGNRNLTP